MLIAPSQILVFHVIEVNVSRQLKEGNKMGSLVNILWTIAVILVVLWLLGFIFNIAGGLIHILLVIAVIVIVYNLLTGRRTM